MQRRIHGSGPDDTAAAHPDIAATLRALGSVCRSEDSYAAARAFYEQSLAMERRIHGSGPDDTTAAHPDIAATLTELGSVCDSEGFTAESAESTAESAESKFDYSPHMRARRGAKDYKVSGGE